MEIIVVKEQADYVRLKKIFRKGMVLLEHMVIVCPFCGKVVRRAGQSFKCHLKWACRKAPWYWPWRAYLFKNKHELKKYGRNYTNHGVTHFINKYIKPYRSFNKYCRHLSEKP